MPDGPSNDPEVDEILSDVPEPDPPPEGDQEDPVADQDDIGERVDQMQVDLSAVSEDVEDLKSRFLIPDLFDPIFPARMAAFSSAVGGAFVELATSGHQFLDFVSGRRETLTSGSGAFFGPPETGFLCVEQVTDQDTRFPAFFPGIVDVYLTKVGGSSGAYTYDGYLDASKTAGGKIFAGQLAPTGSTTIAAKGLARLVGNVWRFIAEVGGAGTTVVSGGLLPITNQTGSTIISTAASNSEFGPRYVGANLIVSGTNSRVLEITAMGSIVLDTTALDNTEWDVWVAIDGIDRGVDGRNLGGVLFANGGTATIVSGAAGLYYWKFTAEISLSATGPGHFPSGLNGSSEWTISSQEDTAIGPVSPAGPSPQGEQRDMDKYIADAISALIAGNTSSAQTALGQFTGSTYSPSNLITIPASFDFTVLGANAHTVTLRGSCGAAPLNELILEQLTMRIIDQAPGF